MSKIIVDAKVFADILKEIEALSLPPWQVNRTYRTREARDKIIALHERGKMELASAVINKAEIGVVSFVDLKLGKDELGNVLAEILHLSIDEKGVIYDEEGHDFYGRNKNLKWDLSTLRGVFTYVEHLAESHGKLVLRREIKKLLNG